MLVDIIRDVGPDTVFLDIGCGYGRLYWDIRTLGIQNYLGVDASHPLLEMARSVLSHTGAEFGHADILSLSSAVTRPVDICLSLFTLSHISRPNIDVALSEIRAVTKTGGRCLLQFIYGNEDIMADNDHIPQLPNGYRVCLTEWTEETLSPHFPKNGFEIVKVSGCNSGYITFSVKAV